MSKPIALAEFVSKEYGLEWDWDSILELFEQYIENQSDEGALLDFLETAASAERDESEGNWRGVE